MHKEKYTINQKKETVNKKKEYTNIDKKEKLVKLEYKQHDGEIIEVEVAPRFKKEYAAIAKKERRLHRKETRRHVSLDYLADCNVEFASECKNPEQIYLEEEQSREVQKALSSLSKEEYEILEQLAEGEFNYNTYAKIQQITIDAAYKRVARLRERAKVLLAIHCNIR